MTNLKEKDFQYLSKVFIYESLYVACIKTTYHGLSSSTSSCKKKKEKEKEKKTYLLPIFLRDIARISRKAFL